jgi:hypothetical protein
MGCCEELWYFLEVAFHVVAIDDYACTWPRDGSVDAHMDIALEPVHEMKVMSWELRFNRIEYLLLACEVVMSSCVDAEDLSSASVVIAER